MSAAPEAVIIAARGGPGAKSRLAPLLNAAERESLAAAMLEAMLTALNRRRVFVVSPTLSFMDLARAHGARAVTQSKGDGLNAAFRLGCNAAFAGGAEVVACLPGDLPRLDPGDIDDAFAAAGRDGAAIVRSVPDSGTGALVFRRGVRIEPAFGSDSFARHQGMARANKAILAEINAPSLANDVDTSADLIALMAHSTTLSPVFARRLSAIAGALQAAA